MTAEKTAEEPAPPAALTAHLPPGVRTAAHAADGRTTAYLEAGPADGPIVLLVHGWPEFGRSWVRLLTPLAEAGFHAVAPDMRGYGASTVHADPDAYTTEAAVGDLLALLDRLGAGPDRPAVVVGHDHGAPVAWNLATHHPERVAGVAGVCVPYMPPGSAMTDHIDRELYPVDDYPYGQWDYIIAHMTMPDELAAEFESDVPGLVASLMRAGSPSHLGRRVPTSEVRRRGRWFPDGPPHHEPDPRVLDRHEFDALVASLTHTGFAGANSWYRNNRANAAYAGTAPNEGRIIVPALFVHARYDTVCVTVGSTMTDPLRAHADDLTEEIVDAGHWVAQEKPAELTAALLPWLGTVLSPASA